MFCPAEMEEMAEMKSLKRLNDQDKLLWLMNNQNQENPVPLHCTEKQLFVRLWGYEALTLK